MSILCYLLGSDAESKKNAEKPKIILCQTNPSIQKSPSPKTFYCYKNDNDYLRFSEFRTEGVELYYLVNLLSVRVRSNSAFLTNRLVISALVFMKKPNRVIWCNPN